jgi:aminoglycoside phosphotransferase (APT) family kinase protein
MIDNTRLDAWLARVLGTPSARVAWAEKLSGGAIQENWALNVAVDGATRACVLRRDAPATIATSRSRAEEYALIRAAWANGVRVPEPLGFCDDPAVIGAPFALMARVAGVGYGPRVVRDAAAGGDRTALGRELGRQLARIHAIAPDPELAMILGPGPIDAGRAEIDRLRGWLDEMGAVRPGLEWALRWAERHAPAPVDARLTHRDFRTGNLMLDREGLTAILDWEFAGWSDPMADLGWFCAEFWRFSRPDLEGGGLCRREDFYAGYAAESGRSIDPARVRWWETMAHVRWAVIALQQGLRHDSGGERSLYLALTGRVADPVDLMALRMTAPERMDP